MLRSGAIFIFSIFFLMVSGPKVHALNSKQRDNPIQDTLPVPPLDVAAWALLEVNSGWVVAGENARKPLPPASITKLMMNYVVFDRLQSGDIKFGDQVPISEAAWRAEGSRMFADVDTKIELKHLLKSTIIQSGNDAAIALAEYVGGSEIGFAQLMNQAAREMGLQDSHFVNSTGLPAPGHMMSASDIAALSAAIIQQHPDYYAWYSEKNYTHNNITQYNRNKLLWKDSTIDGLKTGFTEAAGYCLVGSSSRANQRWIAVVLGSESVRARETAVLNLLNYAYAAYSPVTMLDQQGGIVSAPVYGGEVDQVRLQAAQYASIVVPAGRSEDVVMNLQLSQPFEAPISVGQSMGLVTLTLDGKHVTDVPLISMSAIKRGGVWKRFTDSIKLRWKLFTEE
ncbi:MAG: D-alanyl-D-alanine carboxypeptidase (penicillin-binding protein 5/6) [Cryomorphaceae bacterium]|jgi:D-alanyl-D-alanine carboxypeptidase (penicillin-binding protein 5/6)